MSLVSAHQPLPPTRASARESVPHYVVIPQQQSVLLVAVGCGRWEGAVAGMRYYFCGMRSAMVARDERGLRAARGGSCSAAMAVGRGRGPLLYFMLSTLDTY